MFTKSLYKERKEKLKVNLRILNNFDCSSFIIEIFTADQAMTSALNKSIKFILPLRALTSSDIV